MRHLLALVVVMGSLAISGCVTTPIPPVDPTKAWIDLTMTDGKVIMAEDLDKVRLNDGRYFQVTPGAHELLVRFDFDIYAGSGGSLDFLGAERICYLTVRYEGFKAGERYRLEARSLGMMPMARLYDSHKQKVAEDSDIHCLL